MVFGTIENDSIRKHKLREKGGKAKEHLSFTSK